MLAEVEKRRSNFCRRRVLKRGKRENGWKNRTMEKTNWELLCV